MFIQIDTEFAQKVFAKTVICFVNLRCVSQVTNSIVMFLDSTAQNDNFCWRLHSFGKHEDRNLIEEIVLIV